jgi:hypothetical protein
MPVIKGLLPTMLSYAHLWNSRPDSKQCQGSRPWPDTEIAVRVRVQIVKLLGSLEMSRRNPHRPTVEERVFRVLGRMRRDRVSLAAASRLEGIKQETVVRHARGTLYRSGPGKPWRVRSEDHLSAAMTVLTRFGPTTAIVRSSRERKLLGDYDFALRMWRSGEHGAAAALAAFRGKTVGGHTLITDTRLLIQLEEAGRLDFDTLYASLGSRS